MLYLIIIVITLVATSVVVRWLVGVYKRRFLVNYMDSFGTERWAKKLARVMLVAILALWLIGPTASLLVDLTLHLAGSKSCICLLGNSDPYSDADLGLDPPSGE